MKRRVFALALALVLGLLAGCSAPLGKAERKSAKEESAAEAAPSLAKGYYAVLDGSSTEKIGYMKASYSRLSFYDAHGEMLQSYLYEIGKDSVIYSEGAPLYTLRQSGLELRLVADSGAAYTLLYLSAEPLPDGGYAVYNSDQTERLGYLRVAEGELAFYDVDSKELNRFPFRVSEEGIVTSRGEALYHVKYGWGGLRLTNSSGREYLLVASDAAPE
ncbi:MAG: hypothetical protein IJ617_02350 [Oscillospiraceae bacterium]|nr:hypothetical protein [Oscillospiraceae bacterium]